MNMRRSLARAWHFTTDHTFDQLVSQVQNWQRQPDNWAAKGCSFEPSIAVVRNWLVFLMLRGLDDLICRTGTAHIWRLTEQAERQKSKLDVDLP